MILGHKRKDRRLGITYTYGIIVSLWEERLKSGVSDVWMPSGQLVKRQAREPFPNDGTTSHDTTTDVWFRLGSLTIPLYL
jgi:hypothetical protein